MYTLTTQSQRRLGEAQIGLDRWQRDVHNRLVEEHHELRDRQRCKGDPAWAGGLALGGNRNGLHDSLLPAALQRRSGFTSLSRR
jgi:hypothetical protein